MEALAELQTTAEMRLKSLESESVCEETSSGKYLQFFKEKGVTLNRKLFVAQFHLKNGLPYTGMAARETIRGGEVLIRVPEQLILSSAKAFQQPQLNALFREQSFFLNYSAFDEDKIIVVYSLFVLHSKDRTNPWYEMIRNLPKQCDTACFWSDEELDSFKDKTIKSAAKIDLEAFEYEWKEFQQIQKKHELLQKEEYNKSNYRMIYMALYNRAFGGGPKMQYTSLVPMAELFNHHCSMVYYTVERQQNHEFIDKLQDIDKESASQTSSNGSCESVNYIEEGQFAYEDLNLTQSEFQGLQEEDYNLKSKEKQSIKKQVQVLLQRIEEELNWEDFTILIVGPLIFKTKVIRNQYLGGRRAFKKAADELAVIRRTIDNYKKLVVEYYQNINKKEYFPLKESRRRTEEPIPPKINKKYENMVMKTYPSSLTEPNHQIYFKYGPYSNRSLLLRYGFAIEGNKYEHCWLSFNVAQSLTEFYYVQEKMIEKRISLFRKFKLYNHRLCLDLIVFFRLRNWFFWGENAVEEIFTVCNISKEVAILEQIARIIQDNVMLYEGNYDLSDKALNYHQYFTSVYHIEKLKILRKQGTMFTTLISLLNRLSQGNTLSESTLHLSKAEKVILAPYIASIKL